jgi:hypothetical protein
VVEVEVGDDDVADVGGVASHRADLADRGLVLVQVGPQHGPERLSEPLGVGDVAAPEPGVDQDQPVG